MPLATQCPHCQTTFRVANDQLKLHAGLVRCGACQQTFNGIEHLLAPGAKPAPLKTAEQALPAADFEVPDQAADELAEPAHFPANVPVHVPLPDELEMGSGTTTADSEPQEHSESAPAEAIPEAHFAASSSSLDFDLGQDEPFVQPEAAPAQSSAPELEVEVEIEGIEEARSQSETAALHIEQDDAQEWDTQQDISTTIIIEPDSVAEAAAPETAALAASDANTDVTTDATEDQSEDEAGGEPDEEKPIFVIQAEKKQRRSRIVRISMLLFSFILFLTLLAQASYSLRHQIAARFPQTKPALQEACKFLRCRIAMPAQIDLVTIESSELQTLDKEAKILSLAVLLQNSSGTLQAWPMLELILNDSKEQIVLRRVFTPAEYLANKNDLIKGFAPASEQNVTLHFEISEVKAAGYKLHAFYP